MVSTDDKNNKKPLASFDAWRAARSQQKSGTTESRTVTKSAETAPAPATNSRSFSAKVGSVSRIIGAWIAAAAQTLGRWCKNIAIAIFTACVAAARNSWAYFTDLVKRARSHYSALRPEQVSPLRIHNRILLWLKVAWFAIADTARTLWRTISTGGYTLGKKVATGFFAIILAILLVSGLTRFEFVTTKSGINNSLGNGSNQTVLVDKATTPDRNNLVVAKLPKAANSEGDQYVLGTVFSFNDQTYAIYDGKVIWQIPRGNVKGVVVNGESSKKF